MVSSFAKAPYPPYLMRGCLSVNALVNYRAFILCSRGIAEHVLLALLDRTVKAPFIQHFRSPFRTTCRYNGDSF